MMKYHPKVHGTNCLGTSGARSNKMIISVSEQKNILEIMTTFNFFSFSDLKNFILNQAMPKPEEKYISVILS